MGCSGEVGIGAAYAIPALRSSRKRRLKAMHRRFAVVQTADRTVVQQARLAHRSGDAMNIAHTLLGAVLASACGLAQAIDRDDAQAELAQATTSVQAAERDDAARYAPVDLDEAHAMLDNALHAADARAWTDVAIYSERAKVSGELASARSRQQRAEAATAEIRRSVDALQAGNLDGGVR